MERKPFLVGFRLEFDGVADIVIVELAGEFGFFSERFWGGFSGVVGKCGMLNANCRWNSFSVRWVGIFSVSLEEKAMLPPSPNHFLVILIDKKISHLQNSTVLQMT